MRSIKTLDTIVKEIETLEKFKNWGVKYCTCENIEDINSDNDFVHYFVDIPTINELIRLKLEEASDVILNECKTMED